MDLLKNKTAVITGAHRGIGLAIAKVFAQNGCNLYLVNRKEDPEFSVSVKKLESLYGGSITIDYADFSNTDEVKNVSKKLLSYKVPFDILVNNVGIANPLSLFAMTKLETIKETFDVNFFSSIVLTQALSRNMMKQRKGSIVFVSSSAAYDGGACLEYSASKAAMIGATRRIAMELGGLDTSDRMPTEGECTALCAEMEEFCTGFKEIEKRLLAKGVVVANRVSLLPPNVEYATIINTSDYDMQARPECFSTVQRRKTATGKKSMRAE